MSVLVSLLAFWLAAASPTGRDGDRPMSDRTIDDWQPDASYQPDGYVVELPEVLTRVRPIYPKAALESGLNGTVLVAARVGKDGRVKGLRVARSVPGLDRAARQAVGQWLFRPARDAEGAPVSVWVAVPVRFERHSQLDGAVDALPRLLDGATLAYPPKAKREGIEGTVVLHVLVDERGLPRELEIVRSVPALDPAAEAFVRSSRFEPARIDGKPTAAWVAVPVKFALH